MTTSDPTLDLFGPGYVVAGRFAIEELAGSGGMGLVYKARDQEAGTSVALKVLDRATADGRARFERESSILSRLDHPNIVRYVAHGEAPQGGIYLAMEWLDGEDLEQRLRRGPLSVEGALEVALAVSEA